MAIGGDLGVGMTFLVLKCGGSSLMFYFALRMMGNKTIRVMRPISKKSERIKNEIKCGRWFKDD